MTYDFQKDIRCPNCKKKMTGKVETCWGPDITKRAHCSCGFLVVICKKKPEYNYNFTREKRDIPDVKKLYLKLLDVAGFKYKSTFSIINEYDRDGQPWLLISTIKGLVKLGRRKRVFEINWEDCNTNVIIHTDNTYDKSKYVHAWSNGEAVTFLEVIAKTLEL